MSLASIKITLVLKSVPFPQMLTDCYEV